MVQYSKHKFKKKFYAFVAVFLAFSPFPTTLHAFDVGIYIPSLASNFAIKKILSQRCSSTSFGVFSKSSDYLKAVRTNMPSHIVTLNSHILIPNNYQTRFFPKQIQQDDLEILIVSKKNETTGTQLSVGITNYFGREKTIEFANDIMNQDVRILLATKVEDLLPLLQFRRADAVLLTRSHYNMLAKRTNLQLSVQPTKKYMFKPVISSIDTLDKNNSSVTNSSANQLVECLGTLDQEGLAFFGEVQW